MSLISMATFAAPVTSTSVIDTSEFLTNTPVPSGVAASPTIRKPTSSAPVTSEATTAESASDAVPASRLVTPRGTRLTTRTPLISVSVSWYSPGSTITSDPGAASRSANEMDSFGRTTILAALETDGATARGPLSGQYGHNRTIAIPI